MPATKLIVLSILQILIECNSHCMAASYSFASVADTSTSGPDGQLSDFGYYPSISGGSVAFTAVNSEGVGVYVGSLSSLKSVEKSDSGVHSFGFPAISGNKVAYVSAEGTSTSQFIAITDGQKATRVAEYGSVTTKGQLTKLNEAIALDGDSVIFVGSYKGGNGVFTGDGKSLKSVIATGDAAPTGTYSFFRRPAIDGDSISIDGAYAPSDSAVLRIDGGRITTIAKTGDSAPKGKFREVVNGSISGTKAAFVGLYDVVDQGIFVSEGGTLKTIVKSGDVSPLGNAFDRFGGVSISGNTVAFFGTVSDGQGIFTSRDGSLTTVVKNGDMLFGSTIVQLLFGRFGLDPDGSGNLAFGYHLSDGRSGIAIATQIPEPTSGSLLCAAIFFATTTVMMLVRKQCRSRRLMR